MVVARLSGLDGVVTRIVGRGAPCLSDFPVYLLRQAATDYHFTHVLERNKPVHHFPHLCPIYFSEQSGSVDAEGVAFRPRAVVVWRGVVTGCTRISS